MKPILFNTEMVRAILDGRKTQTRRICNFNILDDERHFGCDKKSYIQLCDGDYGCPNCGGMHFKKYQPKYKVDDVLYVRETFNTFSNITMDNEVGVVYKADNKEVILPCNRDYECEYVFNDKWKPSIHMPKKYARIFLKITNVRVERLQDIEYYGLAKEGIIPDMDYNDRCPETGMPCSDYFTPFKSLWNSTAKDGYKWKDNPFVFIYEFERVENLERKIK